MKYIALTLLISSLFSQTNFILTIDDAPNKYTIPMAKILLSNNIDALWFVCGEELHLKIFKKHTDFLVKNNFSIGNHTSSHNYKYFRSKYIDDIKVDFKKINDYFLDNYNITLTYFRAPYGLSTQYMHIAMEELNLKRLSWHLDFDDYLKEEFTTNEIKYQFNKTINTNRSTYIMLIHANKQCYEKLPFIIEETRKRGKFIKLRNISNKKDN